MSQEDRLDILDKFSWSQAIAMAVMVSLVVWFVFTIAFSLSYDLAGHGGRVSGTSWSILALSLITIGIMIFCIALDESTLSLIIALAAVFFMIGINCAADRNRALNLTYIATYAKA